MCLLGLALFNLQILLALIVHGVTAAHFSGSAKFDGHAPERPLSGEGAVGLAVTSDGAVAQPQAPSATGSRLMRSQRPAVGVTSSGIVENVNAPTPVMQSQQETSPPVLKEEVLTDATASPPKAALSETEQMAALGCTWTEWGAWSACTASCGGGSHSRSRSKEGEDSFCGGTSTEDEPCNIDGCPTDCVWGLWTNWIACTKSCGSGMTYRTRNVTAEATWGGKACTTDGTTSAMEEESCNEQDCNRDCMWSTWADWGTCSAPCGGGVAERTRTVKIEAHEAGAECEGDASEEEPCNLQGCVVHCQWTEWSAWTGCSTTCGGGTKSRGRSIAKQKEYGGDECDGDALVHANCSVNSCPIACEWGSWGEWSSCSATCGTAVKSKTRVIATQAQFNGAECTGNATTEENCFAPPCPVDCTWEDWADWGACSVTCGTGVQRRSRARAEAQFNGTACTGDSVEQLDCVNTASGCPSVAVASANAANPIATQAPEPIAEESASVSGEVELTVEDPAAFAASTQAADSVRTAIAALTSVPVADVEVRLKERAASLLEGKRTSGVVELVDAWYSITVLAGTHSAMETAAEIAQHFRNRDITTVAQEIQAAMTANGLTGTVTVSRVSAAVSTGEESAQTEHVFPDHTNHSMARTGALPGAAACTTVAAVLVIGMQM